MGGIPLQQFNVQALRNHISFVQQDVFLFSDTVADNISFGSKEQVGLEVVKNAASLAAVDKEIESFEMNFMKELSLKDQVVIHENNEQNTSILSITKEDKNCFALQLNWKK